jgi:hypothetical protein
MGSKLHNLESIRRSPPVGWGIKRIQAYFIWAKQVTDSTSIDVTQLTELMIVCAPSHPVLAERINNLYRTAYTRVNGQYYPCHPDVCGAMTNVSFL